MGKEKKNPSNVEIKQNNVLFFIQPVFNLGCGKMEKDEQLKPTYKVQNLLGDRLNLTDLDSTSSEPNLIHTVVKVSFYKSCDKKRKHR